MGELSAVLPFLRHDQKKGTALIKHVSVGQSGTGAPWHWHGDAFNICIVGRRMWYFRPPERALMSRKPVKEGVFGANESLFACQQPGDIVYVPEFWSHSVVNVKLSAALAIEVEVMRYRK